MFLSHRVTAAYLQQKEEAEWVWDNHSIFIKTDGAYLQRGNVPPRCRSPRTLWVAFCQFLIFWFMSFHLYSIIIIIMSCTWWRFEEMHEHEFLEEELSSERPSGLIKVFCFNDSVRLGGSSH